MTRAKKIALALALGLALTGIGAGKAGMQDLASQAQEARKVNEYEGQHRVALNFAKIEFDYKDQG